MVRAGTMSSGDGCGRGEDIRPRRRGCDARSTTARIYRSTSSRASTPPTRTAPSASTSPARPRQRIHVLFGGGDEGSRSPADRHHGIALDRPARPRPSGVQTGISLTTGDIDAVHAELLAAGVDVDAEVMRMGEPVPPMFWFRDPDANTLLIVEQP